MASKLSRRPCHVLSSSTPSRKPPKFSTNVSNKDHGFSLFDPPPPPPTSSTHRLLKDGKKLCRICQSCDIDLVPGCCLLTDYCSWPSRDEPYTKEVEEWKEYHHSVHWNRWDQDNRRPLENEDPREYANRCDVQWHRVSIYPERLGDLAMKSLVRGSIVYVEGNLETKVFNDSIRGLVRRVREIAIRQNGRLVFLNGSHAPYRSAGELQGVGYY